MFGGKKKGNKSSTTFARQANDFSQQSDLGSCKYSNAELVRKQLADATRSFGSLSVRYESFGDLDSTLACLVGTVPVPHGGATYNIPVAVWIRPTHPVEPPKCYVKPTENMRIAQNNSLVNSDGSVGHDYLTHWEPQSSDILTLVQVLIMAFSAQPPVYAVTHNTCNNSRGNDDIQQLRASLETAVMEAVKRGVASEMEVKQVELECLEAVGADLEEGRLRLPAILDSLDVELARTESLCRAVRTDWPVSC